MKRTNSSANEKNGETSGMGGRAGGGADGKETGIGKPARFSGDYPSDCGLAGKILHVGESFDLKEHHFQIGEKRASLFFVDGLVGGSVEEKILEFLMSIKPEEMRAATDVADFAKRFVPYLEVELADNAPLFAEKVMEGLSGLVVEGYSGGILVEVRDYPVRSLDEPENDRVLRGSHDGFVETLQFNTALMRRRLRDPRLIFEALRIGNRSGTDVALCYLDGVARPEQVEALRKKLKSITIPALSLAQESLAECLSRRQWYNPFPRVRYTERPDAAVASLCEGRILVLVDNSPAAMILPTAIFDFLQDTNDYYFPPLIGSYLRFVRGLIFMMTLVLTPAWYLLMKNPSWLPPGLGFLAIQEPSEVPLIVQLLIVELVVDALKLASLNTPSALSNAFGLIGALILGEFAVNVHLFVEQVLLYMSFVAVANFAQPSFELGYAVKLSRLMMLVMVALFDLWGAIAGAVILLLVVATTRTPLGGYLAPLFPFDGKGLSRLLWRHPIDRHNS